MTATAAQTNGWFPETSASSAVIPSLVVPLAANATVGRGQYITYNASGNIALNDGATPCLVSAGVAFPEMISGSSSTAGSAYTQAWWGFGGGNPASTIANDSFTAADIAVPAFIADENTLGKLSNYSGSNRSLYGLVFALEGNGNPRAWGGPVGQAVARGVLVANAFPHAWYTITDAAANTATTERAIPRAKLHGLVTSIEFVGAAATADPTDYATITIAKRSLADAYASPTTLGTYDTRATPTGQGAITAFTPAAFSLSAVAHALELLETDIVTITITKAASGKQLIGEFLVNGKVI